MSWISNTFTSPCGVAGEDLLSLSAGLALINHRSSVPDASCSVQSQIMKAQALACHDKDIARGHSIWRPAVHIAIFQSAFWQCFAQVMSPYYPLGTCLHIYLAEQNTSWLLLLRLSQGSKTPLVTAKITIKPVPTVLQFQTGVLGLVILF